MVSTKKLIAGFLALSILMSLVMVLILPSTNPIPPQAPIVENNTTDAIADNATQPVPANAFTEPIPNIPPNQTADITAVTDNSGNNQDAAPSNDNLNLTEGVGQLLLAEVDNANPNGPQDDGTGQTSLVAPDPSAIADHFTQIQAFQNVSGPNWEADARAQTFPTIDTTSTQDFSAYAQAMKDVLNPFIKSGIQNLSDVATLDALDAPAKVLADTVTGLRSVSVPSPLAGFHTDLLKIMVYNRNAIDLVRGAGSDPMRAALVMQSQQANFNLAMQNFQNDIEKAKLRMVSMAHSKKTDKVMATILSIFGVETANAQWVVFDPLTETMTTLTTINQIVQFLWHILQSILLQLLKNALISLEQGGLKNWILGKGKPLFITNWKSMLKSAFKQAAGFAISQLAPQLCTSFSVGMRTAINQRLNRIFTTNGNPLLTSCTLDKVISNFKNFQNNFTNGGWQAWAATIMPGGNYFGTMYESQALIANQAHFAKNTQTNQAVAGAGFKGTTSKCADGSDPNGFYNACYAPGTATSPSFTYAANPNGSCNPGDTPIQAPNDGACGDGSTPKVTTPGKTVDSLSQNTFSSKLHNIVNAQDIIGLVIQAASAILTKVFGSGASGLFGM